MHGQTKNWRRQALKFLGAKGGNIAMMFGLSLIPLSIAAGAGLDLARAVMVRSSMADALDAAALAIGATPNISQSAAQSLAQQYFSANYHQDSSNYGTPGAPTVSIVGQSVTLSVTDSMPTTLLSAAHINTVPVTVSSTVVWGQSKLWVALVLDNSGSMSQGDRNGSKMDALHDAGDQLLVDLKAASTTAGDVQVAIVPFTREINYGKTLSGSSNVNASWLYWGFWEAAPQASGTTITDAYALANQNASSPATIKFSAWGPGDDCPFTTTDSRGRISQQSPFGFYCMSASANGSSTTQTIPSSGTYKGMICPSIDSGTYNTERNDRYYNGCWTSTKASGTVQVSKGSSADCSGFSSNNCDCSGSGSSKKCTTQKWTHAWVANNHSSWSGCITDRQQDYDIQNIQPVGSNTTGMPADNPDSCLDARVTPLSYDWTTLKSQIDDMQPAGSTNQAIGVVNGWQALTTGDPFSTPTVPANTSRYIILLSDGLNTQDRWYGDGSTEHTSDDDKIDARMASACAAAKSDGVTVFTLFVDINGADGNSAPLQACASDSTKYFDLTATSQIATAFDQIAKQITNLRVSQ